MMNWLKASRKAIVKSIEGAADEWEQAEAETALKNAAKTNNRLACDLANERMMENEDW